jgi:hypothetical protein
MKQMDNSRNYVRNPTKILEHKVDETTCVMNLFAGPI